MAVGQIGANGISPYAYTHSGTQKTEKSNKAKTGQADTSEKAGAIDATDQDDARVYTGGRTIGRPTLSKTAAAYYEKLKAKYGDMDFILVSEDQKEAAKANAASYGNSSKTVVLINEDKVERMASDEKYASKIEGQIASAKKQLPDLKNALVSAGVKVRGFGINVLDNGASSFLATVSKSMKSQAKQQAERLAEKKADKKAAAKKAEKKKAEKRAEEKRAEEASDDTDVKDTDEAADGEETITFSSDSIEDLVRQITDYQFNTLSDSVRTDAEKRIGQSVDYSA